MRQDQGMQRLEQRVVATLRERGLIERQASWWKQAAILFGGIALGAASTLLVYQSDGSTQPQAPGKTFMLALYETPNYRPEVDGRASLRAEEYGRWAGSRPKGRAVVTGGNELAGNASVIGPRPAAGAKLAGYFMVQARSQQDALKLARTNPHLRYGGTVVVHETVRRS